MTQKIEIPVEAKLNAQQAEAAAKKLERVLNSLGRQKVDPVSEASVKKVEALYQAFLKLDRETARRVRATNQSGRAVGDVDWDLVFQNKKTQAKKLSQLSDFMERGAGHNFEPSPGPGGGGNRGGGGGWGGVAAQVAQGGMRAAGPVGDVAAGAVGTGMKSGFGAGLMGLIGGLGALGLGKVVGMVTENIDKAEQNNIAYDRLKRTLGDVNVSFNALKGAVTSTGDGLKLTYGETAQLTSNYVKAGNISGNDFKSLSEELGLGVGLSRAYGLDPSQGVGTLGGLRGVGVTRNTQDTRAMALLIGETIAKSDAFAKADEVMEAIAGFATAQTRQSLAVANTAGYAGMFSSMVGSGIPGMDPANASNILARMNSSLTAGGAKGEASQFFTAMVGNRMGLDPLQTQILREGGMFATNSSSFGKDSVYARYMGKAGPGGDEDFLAATRAELEKRYAGDSDQAKLMRANAFGNHTGLNMRQAMAMLSLQPNQMGELQKYAGDMSTLSASGINNMALSLFGTNEQREGVKNSLMARSDLKAEDRTALERAFSADGSEADQKEVLARLSAQYEQEKTTGKTLEESRALLDNIKTALADKVAPAMQAMRDATIYMAGGKDGTSLVAMSKKVAENEAKAAYGIEIQRIAGDEAALEVRAEAIRNDAALSTRDRAHKLIELDTERQQLRERKHAVTKAYSDRVQQIQSGKTFANDSAAGTPTGAPMPQVASSGAPKGAGPLGGNPDFLAKVSANERAIGAPAGLLRAQLAQESGFKPNAVSPAGAMGLAQVMPATLAAISKRVGRNLDPYNPEDALIIQREVMAENHKKFGNWDDALRAYNGGWDKSRWGNTETAGYVPAIRARMRQQTPIPDVRSSQAPGNGSGTFGLKAEPLEVRHVDSSGRLVAPKQELSFQIRPPAASFADRGIL